MGSKELNSTINLVNGSTGDPVLYIDYPGRDDAFLFDAGENYTLSLKQLSDLEAVLISHHHVDHFIGFDRVIRANIDAKKTLSVYGPAGSIQKIYDRIKSYEYPFFPFQQIVIKVTEIHETELHRGVLECRRRFPKPIIEILPRENLIIHENDQLLIEAELVDHPVPCLNFSLTEKAGYHPDSQKLKEGVLRPGRWIQEVLDSAKQGTPKKKSIEIQGGIFQIQTLLDQYFVHQPASKVTYITDTAYSETSKPKLFELAKKATRLYCDSFYLSKHQKQADKYRHMTALQAAELAKEAKVEQLILIHFSGRYQGQYHLLLEEAQTIFPQAQAIF
ncbi:Metal-dependent hydrolases of the beta-lactamase superfamily III [Planctomycetales bacterium 10988]|nr:Metal-dependent hydrolases of the beta-lactamase superfamily III [Planctomycetales bacterium 10988]